MADSELKDLGAATSRSGLIYYGTDAAGTTDYKVPEGLPLPLDTQSSNPSTPASGGLLFGTAAWAKPSLRWLNSDGAYSLLQSHLATNGVVLWQASGSSTGITNMGNQAMGSTGTATAAAWAGTVYGQVRKIEYLVTVASTTAVAGLRGPNTQWYRGDAAGRGGFHFVGVGGPALGCTNSSHRFYMGFRATNAAPTDADPSGFLNCVGIGYDSADTELQILHNDAAGSATKVALGASFPKPTADRSVLYAASFYCPANASYIDYTVQEMVSGAVASGRITTDLVPNTTALCPHISMSVGGVSSTVGIAFSKFYLEQDS